MVHDFNFFRPLVAAVVLSVALSVAAPSYGQSAGVIRGRVTDGQGVGVGGAKVTAVGQIPPRMTLETESDDDGAYRIMGLAENRYEVTAEKEGVGSASAILTLRSGEILNVMLDIAAAEAAAMATLSEEDLALVEQIEGLKAAFELGVNASNAGQYQEAINQFQIAVGLADFCADCYHNLGHAYVQLEDYEQAETAFKQAIALKADYAPAFTGLVNVYNMQRRFDEAAEASAEAARLSGSALGGSTDPIVVYNQGVIFWNAQKFADAKVQFEQTLQLDPNNADAYYFLAMTNLNQGNMADAATALGKYIELAPDGQYADQARSMLPQLQQ